MRASARGFFLFSFAFSSVLSSAEVVQVSSKVFDDKTVARSTGNNAKVEIQKKEIKRVEVGHELEKRSPAIFPQNGEADKKKEFFDILRNSNLVLDRDELEKRARTGFTGMRGKKEFSVDDYCAKMFGGTPLSRISFNKRYLGDFGGSFGDKRAPTAFHGMRGKKSEDYDSGGIDSRNRVFLADSGLIDEPELEFSDSREKKSAEEAELEKRSPYAFQGMRGKKENVYDLKRAMGFLGMRGKKATEIWDSPANYVNYKRVPQTSFFGMKGKKAQSSGFFGMRGKKASPSAFFGIKGKRDPLDYDFQDFNTLNEIKETEAPRIRFRRGIAWLNNSKKAKNAFFGIRGKKSTQEGSEAVLSSSFE